MTEFERMGIDMADPANDPLLTDLQGNILKGHGRAFSIHLFLRFKQDTVAARAWIRDFAECVDTAKSQWEATRKFGHTSDCHFHSFLLSAEGYRALDVALLPNDIPFQEGMKTRGSALNDPAPDQWDECYRGPIHALIILANRHEDLVQAEAQRVAESVAPVADVVGKEVGRRKFNDQGRDIEQFGFVDGVSQPLFTKEEIDDPLVKAMTEFDPSAPLSLALIEDPNGAFKHSSGSFLVYRKLAEDVAGWNNEVFRLAKELGISPDLAGALAMGRFQDGTPVVASNKPLGEKPGNDFGYDGDRQGVRCPFHAHIRKVNPRGDTNTGMVERGKRIARRGITFGTDNDPEVGLLFLCYQSNIENQFEFQQTHWSNEIQFSRQGTGLDPVIGQGRQPEGGQSHWPRKWGVADFAAFDFRRFVHLRGGEYFFAPSVSFLKSILI
jgi:Dyp-type peroxidase family